MFSQLRPVLFSSLSLFALSSVISCRSVGSSSQVNSDNSGGISEKQFPQIARFTVLMDKLDRDMKGLSPKEAADRLVSGNARETAFLLQALGRLYEGLDPKFSSIRIAYKKLEDGIGAYAKWVELLDKGIRSGAPAEVIAQHTKSRDDARIKLEEMLISAKFVPKDPTVVSYQQSLRDFLAKYPWKSAALDRADMIKRLYDDLEVIKTAPYDFSHLEEGDGVHEFRRKMRWFPMEAKSLNGMVLLKPDRSSCPVPDYANIVNDSIAQHKYAVLPPSATETNPIYLTPCLYIQIAKLVDVVGAIKGDIEEVDNNSSTGAASDSVSKKDRIALQAILDKTLANNLFGRLQEELLATQVSSDKRGVRILNAQNTQYCFNARVLNNYKTTEVSTCSAQTDQNWDIIQLASGYYRLKSAGQGFCVNLKTSGIGDETKGSNCAEHADQSWKVLSVDGGLTQFESQRAPGLCLAMNNASDGDRTIVKSCDVNDKTQLWSVK